MNTLKAVMRWNLLPVLKNSLIQLKKTVITEDKQFLQLHREARIGHIGRIDMELAEK
jgi:hypothetical protein